MNLLYLQANIVSKFNQSSNSQYFMMHTTHNPPPTKRQSNIQSIAFLFAFTWLLEVSNKIKLYLLSEKCNIGMEMKKEKYMLLVRKRKLQFIKVSRKNTVKNR